MVECALLATGAAWLWALINVCDAFIIYRRRWRPESYLVIGALVSVPVVALLFVAVPFTSGGVIPVVLAAASGLLLALGTLLYFYSLLTVAPSIVAGLLQLTPLFSVLLSLLVFREPLGAGGFLGAVIMAVSGAMLAASPIDRGPGILSRSASLPVITACLFALAFACQYFALSQSDRASVFLSSRIGFIAGALCACGTPRVRERLTADVRLFTRRLAILVALIEVLNLLAFYLIIEAFDRGPFGVVLPITAIQPLAVVVLSAIGERGGNSASGVSRRLGWIQIVAMIAMILGMFMLLQDMDVNGRKSLL